MFIQEASYDSKLKYRELEGIVDNAETVADETLGHSKNEPTEVHHHHHNNGLHWWTPLLMPSHHTTVNNYGTGSNDGQQRENDGAARLLIGIAFSAVALATSYFIGKDFGRLGDVNDEIQRVNNELWTLDRCKNSEKIRKLTHIVNEEKQLLNSKRRNTMIGLALKTTMVTASILGIAGAIVGTPPLMIGGAVIAVAAGAGMLVKIGYNHTSHRHERKAKKILSEIDEIRRYKI